MTSDPAPDMTGDLDGYLQRAELLAELGRYDDAVVELDSAMTLAPADLRPAVMLARVQLAAGRPAEALAAAESVLATGGADPTGGRAPDLSGGGGAGVDDHQAAKLRTQVIRGFALADLRRFPEAAEAAERLVVSAPVDSYAQRGAAAILAESRNGQTALNAAWRAVELAPREPQAHLVLSLVAARLGRYELAERAYREALELDPELGDAARDVGVIRLERRRYATALEAVAESMVPAPERPEDTDRRGYPAPGRDIPDAPGPAVSPPWRVAGPVDALRRLVLYAAGYTVVAAVLAACLASGNPGLSRVVAGLAAIGGGVVLWALAARTPGLLGSVLPELLNRDRALALAGYATLAGPALILVYALVGTPWPLVLAIAVTAVAELVVLRRGLPPPPPASGS